MKNSIRDDDKLPKPERSVAGGIWHDWADIKDAGRSRAYIKLQKDYARHFDDIVPHLSTLKEFTTMIADLEPYTTMDKQSDADNPMEVMAEWLRGDSDLSRIRITKSLSEDGEHIQ